MKFFISNNLFSNYQYGFIKRRSTVLQLLHILDKWTQEGQHPLTGQRAANLRLPAKQ